MLCGRTDGAAVFICVTLWGPDGTKQSRHGRQTSGACEVGWRVDETGMPPGSRHAGWSVPGRRGAVANEVRLNFRGAGETIGVIHVFFWKGIVTVQFQRAVHAGKLAFTGCTPVNETAVRDGGGLL